jgi:hypothetical protein
VNRLTPEGDVVVVADEHRFGEHVVELCREAVLGAPGKVIVIVLPSRPLRITNEDLGVILVTTN